MTVFGFNTDIKYGDTIYHVQSEERRNDSLLQTQVFVRGRCIGKHASSYAHIKDRPDFTEEQMHELLKAQHKTIVDAVRAGRVSEVLHPTTDQTMTFARPVNPVAAELKSPGGYSVEAQRAAAASAGGEKGPQTPTLELQFVNPDSIFSDNTVCFRFLVTDAGRPLNAAKLVARFQAAAVLDVEEPPIYAQAVTAADGSAEIILQVSEASLHLASLLVQATHSAKVVTRKFRLKGK